MKGILARLPFLADQLGSHLHPLPASMPALAALDKKMSEDLGLGLCALESTRTQGWGKASDQTWQDRREIIDHDSCRVVSGKHQTTQCLRFGFCVCTGVGKKADSCWRALASHLKKSFAEGCRKLLVGGEVVLQFRFHAETDDQMASIDDTDEFFSLPIMSLSPLDGITLRLASPRACEENEAVTSFEVALGNAGSLRDCPRNDRRLRLGSLLVCQVVAIGGARGREAASEDQSSRCRCSPLRRWPLQAGVGAQATQPKANMEGETEWPTGQSTQLIGKGYCSW